MLRQFEFKKIVQTDLRKVFQHILLQSLLNIIHSKNSSGSFIREGDADQEPLKVLTIVITYNEILNQTMVKEMLQKILDASISNKMNHEDEDSDYIFKLLIRMYLEALLKDQSNDILLKFVEMDYGYPNPMILGNGKTIVLLIELDREATDIWLRLQQRPIINDTIDDSLFI